MGLLMEMKSYHTQQDHPWEVEVQEILMKLTEQGLQQRILNKLVEIILHPLEL